MGWRPILKKLGAKSVWEEFSLGPRKYQASATFDGKQIVQFAPSGNDKRYFLNYVDRINGAGRNLNTYSREFPQGENMEGQYLGRVNLSRISLSGALLRGCNFKDATLFGTEFYGALADYANFSEANCFRASFRETRLDNTNFEDTNFYLADLRETDLSKAIGLTQEQLEKASAGTRGLPLPEGLKAPKRWTRSRRRMVGEAELKLITALGLANEKGLSR
jgi:hypothetical protein